MISEVFLLGLIIIVFGRKAPNAHILEDFRKTPDGSLFSEDVYDLAFRDAPGLITKYGYPVEIHEVVTPDDYILELHRIPHGRERVGNDVGPKSVVFLMHGTFSSSADFVVLGPEDALALLLADNGYDVWLGNARGNYYSRNHISLNPNNDTKFWDFSWEEIGYHDVPTSVNYILDITGEESLHYVGHSQGGTVFLVLNSMIPEYNKKFKSFQGLAPSSYFTYNDNEALKNLAKFEKLLEKAVFSIGTGEISTNSQARRVLSTLLCYGKPIFDPLCVENIKAHIHDLANVNTTMIPLFLANSPAGGSAKQPAHFGQVIRRDSFARYYYNLFSNFFIYGSINPPEFNVSKITVPSFLYYGLSDNKVFWKDVEKLAVNLGGTAELYGVKEENFNHYDFIWRSDVRTLLYDIVVRNIDSMN